jgi:hypothetical protein
MSSYRSAEPTGATPDPSLQQMPCTFCGAIVTRATLTGFGARCIPCFRAYVQREQPPMPRTPDFRPDHKAWAKRLHYRETHGDALSPLQKKAWRDALKVDTNEPLEMVEVVR